MIKIRKIVPKKFAICVYLYKFYFSDEYPFSKVNTWSKNLEKERWQSYLLTVQIMGCQFWSFVLETNKVTWAFVSYSNSFTFENQGIVNLGKDLKMCLVFFWDQIWALSKANLTQIKFSGFNQNWVGAKRGSLLPWPHLQVMNFDWKWTAILLKITIFIFNKVCKCNKDLVHQDLNNYWKV